MPRKIRELESDLRRAGFKCESGKSSHRRYSHESGAAVTISGQEGADAKRYQEQLVATALAIALGRIG